MSDADFFAAPPADAPPAMPTDAPPLAPGGEEAVIVPPPADEGFIGDVDGTGAPPSDGDVLILGDPNQPPAGSPDGMDFAGAPTDFAAAPVDFAAPPGDFAAPPEGGAILLGPGPDEVLGGEEEAVPGAEGELPPPEPTEPSAMQKWNEEWQQILLERKDAENTMKGEVVEQARVDLEKFATERETRREARMKKNRSDEQEKLETIALELENDNSWQRVVKLVELTHDTVEGAADVARMRDVMIILKNDTQRATTLSA